MIRRLSKPQRDGTADKRASMSRSARRSQSRQPHNAKALGPFSIVATIFNGASTSLNTGILIGDWFINKPDKETAGAFVIRGGACGTSLGSTLLTIINPTFVGVFTAFAINVVTTAVNFYLRKYGPLLSEGELTSVTVEESQTIHLGVRRRAEEVAEEDAEEDAERTPESTWKEPGWLRTS